MSSLFGEFFLDDFFNNLGLKNYGGVQYKDGKAIVTVSVAGFKKENVDVKFNSRTRVLHVTAKKDGREFVDAIALLFKNYDTSNLSAKVEDGLLTVEIPFSVRNDLVEIKVT